MELNGVVDRIEADLAVILVGDDETEVTVPASQLPEGSDEGSWLKVTFDVATVELDPTSQAEAEERIEGKLDRLRRRGSRLSPSD